MDRFSKTLLAAAAEAGLATITLSRHVPSMRISVNSDDQVMLLARCLRPDGRLSGDHLMLLTQDRMVVTKQSRVLGRVRLDMDAPVTALGDVRWSADPSFPGVELAFTSEDTRHRFWIDASHSKRVWRLDALLAKMFRRPTVAVATLAGYARGFI
ncbi:MAG: hypothetical protein ACRDXX_02415 [Stackebrandtia sp.]